MVILLLLLIIGLLIISYYRITLGSDKARKFNEFPGPKLILPFLGNFLDVYIFNGGRPRNYNTWIAKYGKNIRFWNFHLRYLFTTDLEVIEKVLSSNIHIEKSVLEYKYFLKGLSILSAPGHMWKRDRKLLTPAFGKGMTNTFTELVNQHSVTLMHTLEKHLLNDKKKEKDIDVYLGRCTLDIMTEFLTDEKPNFQASDPLNAAEKMIKNMNKFAVAIYRPWIAFPIIRYFNGVSNELKIAAALCHQVITKEMLQKAIQKWRPLGKELAKGADVEEQPTKAIHYMAAAGFPERNMFYQVMGLTGAGSDTTASAIAGICFLLAAHPHVQQKVRKEVYEVIREYHFKGEITKDQLKQMIYLESAIKECLRIVSPGRWFGRKIGADIKLTQVHTDPEYYELPHKFIPERFLPQNSLGRAQYSAIPFSAGPRSCIGQHLGMLEMKIMIARMLLWYEIVTTKQMEEVKWGGIVASPYGGLSLSLKKLTL